LFFKQFDHSFESSNTFTSIKSLKDMQALQFNLKNFLFEQLFAYETNSSTTSSATPSETTLFAEQHSVTTTQTPPSNWQTNALHTKMAITIYEMQTISNALIAYAKLLNKKNENSKAQDARKLEKRIFDQLLTLDTEQ